MRGFLKNLMGVVATVIAIGVSGLPALGATTLAGDTITASYVFTTSQGTSNGGVTFSPSTVTVGSTGTSTLTASYQNMQLFKINITATSISLTFLMSLQFNNAIFSGISLSGITQPSSSFATSSFTQVGTSSTYQMSLAGQSFTSGQTVQAATIAAVPLPSAWILLLAALAMTSLFALSGRPRSKVQAPLLAA